jgi:hypothetical protein
LRPRLKKNELPIYNYDNGFILITEAKPEKVTKNINYFDMPFR